VALLGDGPELIGTPGVAPVAAPRMFHHLIGRRERRKKRRESESSEL